MEPDKLSRGLACWPFRPAILEIRDGDHPASVALNWLRLLSANRDDRSLWGCSARLPMSGTQVRQLTKEGRSSDRAPTASAGCGPSALLASAYPRCREISVRLRL